ncbi:MFS transporter [Nocardioides sp.]|uniref:MFS transporter n=1 Tax=Nocardioides sp. TaxID=35761 RepID=UPI0035164547
MTETASRPALAATPADLPQRAVLATLMLVTTVTAVISSLGAPLVPTVARRFDVPLSAAQWTLTATLLAGAVATPVLGRLGSGRWRRPVMLATIGVVLGGAVLAAAPLGDGPLAFAALVTGRALQGVGLGLVPLALAAARDLWRGPLLDRNLGLLSVTTVAGAGLGYPLTGFLADHLGLHGAHTCGALLLLTTLLLAVRFLPRAGSVPPQPVDLVGAVLLGGGMVALLLAVSQGEHWGWAAPRTLLLAVLGTLLVAAWTLWSRGRAHPLVDLRLAARPGVAGPHVVAACLGVGMYGLLTLAVLVVQRDPAAGPDGFGLGLGPVAAGAVLVPYSLASVSGNQLARRVAARFGSGVLLPVGCTSFALALVVGGTWHAELWQVLLAMGLGGLGSGFTFSSLAALIVPHVPRAETGSAMAFNQLMRYLGFSVGSAVSVALLAAYGGDDLALRGAYWTLAALCLLAAGADRLTRRRRTSGPVPTSA